MGQEFIINSEAIESKINQLLPSQGGFGAGVDFSASTTIVPIINLTETAEGSAVRQDLQTALSFSSVTSFNVANATTSIITTTGYWRVFGTMTSVDVANPSKVNILLNDSVTDKIILDGNTGLSNTGGQNPIISFDFNVFLKAGDVLIAKSTTSALAIAVSVRQLATIDGNLINP